LTASFPGGAESQGFFLTDGGVLGQGLSLIVIPQSTKTLYAITFNSTFGSNKTWSYALPAAGANSGAVYGPSALYVSNANYIFALDKATGSPLWIVNNTFHDDRNGMRRLEFGAARLGYGPTPSVGAKQRGLQVTPTKSGTRSAAMTKKATASFNPVYQSVGGGEVLLFSPLLTTAGLILQVSLRFIYALNSTTGRLAWFRVTGAYDQYNINVGGYGAVSFTSMLSLSDDESVFCGGVNSGVVFCAQTADGSLIWSRKITAKAGGFTMAPLFHNNSLFVASAQFPYVCPSSCTGWTTAQWTAVYPDYIAGHVLLSFAVDGRLLLNASLPVAAAATTQSMQPLTVLPSFVSPSVAAIAIALWDVSALKIIVVGLHSQTNATVLRSISLPVTPGSWFSEIAADAVNALFLLVLDGDTFRFSLYRVNATAGVVSWGREVAADAPSVSTPNYLSLIVGSGAVMIADFSGGVYVYR
jgi:outer membrane protein assembly factor BamB